MACSFTVDSPRSRNFPFMGSKKVRFGTGNCGTGYATGGAAIDTAAMKQLGLRRLDHLDVSMQVAGATRLFSYDKTNQKVLCFTALSTEAANASDQSAQTFRFMAIGD